MDTIDGPHHTCLQGPAPKRVRRSPQSPPKDALSEPGRSPVPRDGPPRPAAVQEARLHPASLQTYPHSLACPSALLGPSLPLALFRVRRRAPRPQPPPIRIPTNVLNILQGAAARARILTDRTTYGIWAHNPNIGTSPLVVAQAALAYLESIFPLYDTSDAEVRAASAGEDLFLQEPSALSDVRTEHTRRVLQRGLLPTIIDLQDQCPFGFTEARCTATFSQDPDFPRLLTLARDGACKDLPPGFVPQPMFLLSTK